MLEELNKEIPAEFLKRMSLNRFFAMQRDIVNDELQDLIPDLVEDALENPTGSYQLVSQAQNLKLQNIEESSFQIKADIEEIKELLGKVKKGVDGSDNGLLGNIFDMLAGGLGLGGLAGGAYKVIRGKKGKGVDVDTKTPKKSRGIFGKLRTLGKIGLGVGAASYLFGDELGELGSGALDYIGTDGAVDTALGVAGLGASAGLIGLGANKLMKNVQPTATTATQTGSNIMKGDWEKGSPYYTRDEATGKTKFVSKAEGLAAEAEGRVTYKGKAEPSVAKAAEKTGAKTATKSVGKSLLKKIPGLGLLAGGFFAAQRLADGDYTGAAMEVASGAASLVPGVGTAASVAMDTAIAARDMGAFSGPEETATNISKEAAKETETPATPSTTPLTTVMKSLSAMGADKTESDSLISTLTGQKENLSKLADLGTAQSKSGAAGLLSLAMGGGDVTGDKLKQLGIIAPNASAEEVDAAVKEYSDIAKAGPTVSPEMIAAQANAPTATQNIFAPQGKSITETTIDNNPNAQFNEMINQMMANFQEQNAGPRNSISAPVSSTLAMPRFTDIPTPTSIGVVALRSQGIADVYSHPQGGSTIERSDRGGETMFF